MQRLGMLMVVTLAGIWAVLSVYGNGDLRGERRAMQAEAATITPEDDAKLRRAQLIASLQEQTNLVPITDDAQIVRAGMQTPEKVQRFPGPALVPAPEHAVRKAASAPIAGGPRLYVTGSRVNMRSGPGTGNAVVAALTGGTEVVAVGPMDAAWIEIRDRNGQQGFMSQQFLSPDAP